MGCGKSKQKIEENGPPGNTMANEAGIPIGQLPDYEEVLEPEDVGQEDPEEKFQTENFDKFIGVFTFLMDNVGSLGKRQEIFRKKWVRERNNLLGLMGRIRDFLTLSDLSTKQMAAIGRPLENASPKLEAFLAELSKLDIELQPVYDFGDNISDGKEDGLFIIPPDEDLRDALEGLTAAGRRLLTKSKSIRFGILEMMREIDIAKFWIAISIIRAQERDLLREAKRKLQNEVEKLKSEKEWLTEENENSKVFLEKLKKLNFKLYDENERLKKSNKELKVERDSLDQENQKLKATLLNMVIQMEAAKQPSYPKEPDLRPEPPNNNPELVSSYQEPNLLPEPRTDIGPHSPQPLLSSDEEMTEKSSMPKKEKRKKRLKVGWLPGKSLTETFAVEKFDYSNVRHDLNGNLLPPSLRSADKNIPGKNLVSVNLQASQLPKSEVQDGDEVQRQETPGAANDNSQPKKPKKKPGLFKGLFKGFNRRRQSGPD